MSIDTIPMFDVTGQPTEEAAAPVAPTALWAPTPPPWAPVFEVAVVGLPGPQGSKTHKGGGRMIESSAKVKPWRDAVAWTASAARRRAGLVTLSGPLLAEMVFSFPRPRGHYGTGRNSELLRPSAPLMPDVTPDLSKLARSTEDALTTAQVYRDDALLVGYVRLEKRYVTDHPAVPGVLDTAGCTIRLWRLTPGGVCQ